MADDDSKASTDLDLTSVSGFDDTVIWVRNNVVLGGAVSGIVELKLNLPSAAEGGDAGSTSLFMKKSDAYVVGFRGKDGVYLLDEENQDFEKLLRDSKVIGKDDKISTIDGLGTDHRSLGTFRPDGQGRTYGYGDLLGAGALSQFSTKEETITREQIKGALSLLICMTAESARSKMTEADFRMLYYHARVQASDSMQSYDKAKRLTGFAECFPNAMRADRVEKLVKRSVEIQDLFARAEATVGETGQFDRKGFVTQALAGTVLPKLAETAKRMKEIAWELGAKQRFVTADEIVQIVSLCQDPAAIRAAQAGVIVPPVGRPTGT